MKMIRKNIETISFYVGLLFLFSIMLSPFAMADTYGYAVQFGIKSNGTTSFTNPPIVVSINNTALNQLGYITVSGLDTSVGPGLSTMPFSIYRNVTAFLYQGTLPASQSVVITQKLGWAPVQTSFDIVTGPTGQLVFANTSTMNFFGNDFQLDFKGWIDTGTTGSILAKSKSWELVSNGDGTITFALINTSGNMTDILRPDGDISPNQFLNGWPLTGSHWSTIDEVVADDNDFITTKTPQIVNGMYEENYSLTNTTLTYLSGGTIYITTRGNDVYSSTPFTGNMSLGAYYTFFGNTTMPAATAVFNTTTLLDTRPGYGGPWLYKDLNNLKAGFIVKNPNNIIYNATIRQFYVFVESYKAAGVTSGMSSGDHLIQVTRNATTLAMYIDGVSVGTSTYPYGPCTTNSNIIVSSGGVAKAIKYINLYNNGAQKLYIKPTTIMDPTNIPDVSGSGNPAAALLSVNTSPIEITQAGITALASVTPPSGNTTVVPQVFPIISNLTMYPNMTSNVLGLPAYEVVNAAANSLGWTTQFTYSVLMGMTSIALGFAGFIATKSMFAGVGMMIISMGAAASTTVFPPWIPLILLIGMIMYIVVSRGM